MFTPRDAKLEGFYNSKFNSKIANLCFDFIQPHPLSWIFALFCLKYFMICKNLKSGFNNFDQIKTKWKFMIRGGLSTVQKYRPELLISSHLTESAQDKRISNQRKGKLLKWKQTQQLHEFKSWNYDVVKTKKSMNIARKGEYMWKPAKKHLKRLHFEMLEHLVGLCWLVGIVACFRVINSHLCRDRLPFLQVSNFCIDLPFPGPGRPSGFSAHLLPFIALDCIVVTCISEVFQFTIAIWVETVQREVSKRDMISCKVIFSD